MKKNTILAFLAHLIVWMNIVLPSGSLFNLNVKLIVLVLFLILLICFNRSNILIKLLLSLVPVFGFIIFELCYTIFFKEPDMGSMLGQAKDIFIFFTYFYLLILFFKNDLKSLSNSIINAAVFVGFLKFIILLYGFLFNVSISDLM